MTVVKKSATENRSRHSSSCEHRNWLGQMIAAQ